MNAGRDVERLIADWLVEESPRHAPNRILGHAAEVIDRTQQRRLRVAWRPKTMSDRILVAAAAAVLAVGTFTLGASLILRSTGPATAACPREYSEADAVDTFAPGLTPAQRAWGIDGGKPGSVRPGLIAAFAWETVESPQSVITIDPATGARCRLLRFVENKPIRANITRLDWSPSGDALAMGIENPHDADGNSTGQVLIWTSTRLVRIWTGPGQTPGLEWAPDGRSIVVWMSGGDDAAPARVIFADGSPDRTYGVQPSGVDGLKWSPDGSRWIVARDSFETDQTTTTLVDVGDGRQTPVDLGIAHLSPEAWLDDERVLLYGVRQDGSVVGYLDVPLAAPAGYSVANLPDAALHPFDQIIVFSPDRRRAAYSDADGHRQIADFADGPSVAPIDVNIVGAFAPGPAWAPDGSRLVYVTPVASSATSAGYAVWKVNADGTDLRQIAGGGLWTMDDPWQPVPVR